MRSVSLSRCEVAKFKQDKRQELLDKAALEAKRAEEEAAAEEAAYQAMMNSVREPGAPGDGNG